MAKVSELESPYKKGKLENVIQKLKTASLEILKTRFRRGRGSSERKKTLESKNHLVSGIWSFRITAIAPTNNSTSTTEQRPTHFFDTDTAILYPLLTLSALFSDNVYQRKRERETRRQRKKKIAEEEGEEEEGETVGERAPTKQPFIE